MAGSSGDEVRICVLVSGNGSNLQALVDNANSLGARIVLVISNLSSAYGLKRAEAAGISHKVHSFVPFKGRDNARSAYDLALADLVLQSQAQLVCCLGYMRVLQPSFLEKMDSAHIPVLNLHPALPGEYNGLHAIERAHQDWRDGKIARTGVMIHRVIQEVDAGEPVVTREIPFVTGEDEDIAQFEQKVHSVEHQLVIEGVDTIMHEIREAAHEHSRHKA